LLNNIIPNSHRLSLERVAQLPFIQVILALLPHYSSRFMFFLFLALLIHAFIIFQVGFSLPEKLKLKPKKMDIVINLAKTKQQPKVKNSDYFAQSNQQGGGKQELKHKPTNVLPASPKLVKEKPLTPIKKPKPAKKIVPPKITQSQLSTQVKSKLKAKKLVKKTRKDDKKNNKVTKTLKKPLITSQYLTYLKKQIIDLEADIDLETKVYSRRSKYKYINASTAKALDAEYIRQWTRKIERIGNLNYPVQAQNNKLSGKLILAVTIGPKGNILNIKIRKSSKHKILDDAAIRIVRLSAPFAAIPESVLKDNNALVITRTWLFSQKNSSRIRVN